MIKNCSNCYKSNIIHPYLHLFCMCGFYGRGTGIVYSAWEGDQDESSNENSVTKSKGEKEDDSAN